MFSILAWINTSFTKAHVEDVLLEKTIMEVTQIGKQVEILMEHNTNVEELQTFTEDLAKSNDHIAYAVIIDSNVSALAHSDTQKIGISYADDPYTVEGATQGMTKNMEFYADVQKTWVYDVMVPIYVGEKQVGAMDVGIYQNQILGLIKVLTSFQIVGIILLEVIFGGLWYFICHFLLKHLKSISEALEAMAQGDFTVVIDEKMFKQKDEIGLISHILNNMRISLSKLMGSVIEQANKIIEISSLLAQNADKTKSASTQITHAVENVVNGNKEQTELSKQTATMSEEIHIGMERITENIQSVTEASNKTVQKAESGNKLVQNTIMQMEKINDQVTSSYKQIQMLGEKSKEIENITGMITQLAGQTNLLALNASIEAARAGEQGKGFAVVAEQVRVLAEQSTKAADDISNIIAVIRDEIEESVASMNTGIETVNEGLLIVNETGENFKGILKEISEVSEEMESVSAITEEVNAGTQSVLSNIESVADIVDHTSKETEGVLSSAQEQDELMSEVTVSSEELMKLSSVLQEQIKIFKI